MDTVHRSAFCLFPVLWIYKYGSNKSIGKETDKTLLCAVGSLGKTVNNCPSGSYDNCLILSSQLIFFSWVSNCQYIDKIIFSISSVIGSFVVVLCINVFLIYIGPYVVEAD